MSWEILDLVSVKVMRSSLWAMAKRRRLVKMAPYRVAIHPSIAPIYQLISLLSKAFLRLSRNQKEFVVFQRRNHTAMVHDMVYCDLLELYHD